jgi:hypothetical protein
VIEGATEEETARFFRQVEKLPNGCWFWNGARTKGQGNIKWYGSFKIKRDGKWRTVKAHGYSCEVIGKKPPLPKGHERDHLCRFSLCIRPEHIEYVTKRVNGERRWKDRTHEPEMHFDV